MERKPKPKDILASRIHEHNQNREIIVFRINNFFEERVLPDFSSEDELHHLSEIYGHVKKVQTDAAWITALTESDLSDEQILAIWETRDRMMRSGEENTQK